MPSQQSEESEFGFEKYQNAFQNFVNIFQLFRCQNTFQQKELSEIIGAKWCK